MYWNAYDERIKGFTYAEEPHRLRIITPNLMVFDGRHSLHFLLFVEGRGWACDCEAYWRNCVLPYGGWCRHTIAAERILASQALEAWLPASRIRSCQPYASVYEI